MIKTYKNTVTPHSHNFILIELEDREVERIEDFCDRVIEAKIKESQYDRDYTSMRKRFYTGTAGELAVEKYLETQGVVDWTIGDSKLYHKADLTSIGVDAGVKTVEFGMFPIVFKESYSPEIICILWKKKWVYICGIASPYVLDNHQDINLVLDQRLKDKGTKSAFWGFNQLKQFKNLVQLKNIINDFKRTIN